MKELTREERLEQRRQAYMRYTRHDHPAWMRDPMTRENCGACLLQGYHPRGEARNDINYAGWERIYIQIGLRIPPGLFEAFLNELANDDPDNRGYVEALRDDVRYWGVDAWGKGADKFKAKVANITGYFLI